MRLDKYLCESTELSRADAKKCLHRSEVTCDGVVIKNPAFKVPDGCDVRLLDEPVSVRGIRYIMLNKPMDTLCSNVDEVYPSVLSLLDIPKAYSLHIAGRLDADTTGLVLITDDGQWSHRMTSPVKACGKRYRVWLADPILEDKMTEMVEWFAKGVALKAEKVPTKPAVLEMISANEVLLTITEGKYHQVKRMFAAAGNKVVGLHREQIGEIELDAQLAAGEWRYLTQEEVESV
ncbi:16S rRNA pseudouridine(516) synthase RsuA [uncultured Endozoicomonas sp.]|uniref:16S rRNA pseudouridine(516) synthase RsuA n=1 Tax=uncultured Endozoicomonas sp. TaxID=432652 RepID=UPI00262E78DB|nr:16S rRNA pseudouridine(516) synthase RsuA [uncultured Endozoicomonas sp.]